MTAALVLALAGCVGTVEIAPLPYAHPAHPDAPAGTTPEVGSMLDAPSRETGADPGGGEAMKGRDHSAMGHAGPAAKGGGTEHGGGHEG